jgi:hypothetical protein
MTLSAALLAAIGLQWQAISSGDRNAHILGRIIAIFGLVISGDGRLSAALLRPEYFRNKTTLSFPRVVIVTYYSLCPLCFASGGSQFLLWS